MDYPESIAEFAKQIFEVLRQGGVYVPIVSGGNQNLEYLQVQDLIVATKQLDAYLGRTFDAADDQDRSLIEQHFSFDNETGMTVPQLRKWVGDFQVTLVHDVEHHLELIIALVNWALAESGVTVKRSRIPVPFPQVLYGLFATNRLTTTSEPHVSPALGYGGRDATPQDDTSYTVTLKPNGKAPPRDITAYTHFRLNQPGRWANGFPWDASTDADQQRSFFNNVVFHERFYDDGPFNDIYLDPIVDIEAGDEIYAQYGRKYGWRHIYRNANELKKLRSTDEPTHDWTPLRDRRDAILDYAENAKVIRRLPAVPAPAPAPVLMPQLDLLNLYENVYQQISQPDDFDRNPERELVKWQTASVEGSITRYEQFRRSIPPQLAAAISGYVVRAQDLNESPRLAALIVLANLIDGPYLSATGRLYADKDYKSKDIITVDNVYFPDFDQVDDRRRTLFSMVNAPYYTVPDPGTTKRDPAVPFTLGEKGIWIKEYAFVPGGFQTAADFKALRRERTNVLKAELDIPKSDSKKKKKKKFYLLPKSGAVIKKGDELFVKFQQRNNGILWSRQGLESLPEGNEDMAQARLKSQQDLPKRRKMGSCIGCQAPAVKACSGCQTPFCGEACRIEHWEAIGCPCKSRGRATRK